MINNCNVLNLFSELVRQKYPKSTPDEISSKDHESADQLFLLFDQLINSTELLIDNIVTLDFDDYHDDNEEYQEEITDSNQANVGGIKYSHSTMRDTVLYSKTHSFPSLRNRYRSIKFRQQLHRIKRYVGVEGTKNQKLQRIDEFVIQKFTHARQSCLPVHDFDLRRLAIIGLVRNFLRFFRKFPGTVENVLEYSILGVYIDSMNTVRMTIKLWKWKLISN